MRKIASKFAIRSSEIWLMSMVVQSNTTRLQVRSTFLTALLLAVMQETPVVQFRLVVMFLKFCAAVSLDVGPLIVDWRLTFTARTWTALTHSLTQTSMAVKVMLASV
jgi:hypothetical protein